MKHVFGPVPSRRLGRSLGVDVVPFKVIDNHEQPLRDEQVYPDADWILGTLSRRPCTIQEVVAAHSLHRNETIKCLSELTRRRMVERILVGTDLYYRATRQPGKTIAGILPEE